MKQKRLISLILVMILTISWFPTILLADIPGMSVWTATSYENIFKDNIKTDIPTAGDEVNILMAKNEYESSQVVLRCTEEFTIQSVEFTDLTNGSDIISNDNIHHNFVGYVNMKNSEGQNQNTVIRWTNGANDYFPDMLLNEESIVVPANTTQPTYVTVYAPKDTQAGIYTGTVTFHTDLGDVEVPMNVEVIDAMITDSENAAYTQAYWQQLANTWKKDAYAIPIIYGFEKYSPEWWAWLDECATALKETRINSLAIYPMQLLTDGGTTVAYSEEYPYGEFNFNWSIFDQYIQTFIDRDVVKHLEGNALLGTVYNAKTRPFILTAADEPDGTYITSPVNGVEYPVKWKMKENYFKDNVAYTDPTAVIDPETESFFHQYLSALSTHLKEKGWYDMWVQHIEDEALSDREKAEYKDFLEIYTLYFPDGKYGDPIDSTGSTDFMLENTTAQFPLTTVFDGRANDYSEKIDNGELVWMYSCLNPQGNNLNKFIDKPVWQIRSIGWLAYKYGATGHLQWSWNGGWTHPDGTIHTSMNDFRFKGDDFLVYPDVENNSIMQSIRSYSMRDSSEEYELLSMVGGKSPKHKQWTTDLINSFVVSNSNYSSDTTLMVEQREKLYRVAEGGELADYPVNGEIEPPPVEIIPVNPGNAHAYWSFDSNLLESNGNMIYDHSQPVVSGNPITFGAGRKNNAAKFDGTNAFQTNYIGINPAATDFSASLWFKSDDPVIKEIVMLAQKGAGRTWCIVDNAYKIAGTLDGSTPYASTKTLIPNKWYHVVLSVTNTSSGQGKVDFYVNGVKYVDGFSTAITSSTDGMLMGKHKNGGKNLNGMLDEVKIFNKALTNGEVLYLFEDVPPSAIVGYEPIFVETGIGVVPELPNKVELTRADGISTPVDVVWEQADIDASSLAVGVYTVNGTADYNGGTAVTATVTTYGLAGDPITVTTYVGKAPKLPNTVSLTDGTNSVNKQVFWNYINPISYARENTFIVNGFTEVGSIPVSATVTVISPQVTDIYANINVKQGFLPEYPDKAKVYYQDLFSNEIDVQWSAEVIDWSGKEVGEVVEITGTAISENDATLYVTILPGYSSLEPVSVSTSIGVAPTIPTTVTANKSQGGIETVNIVWNTIDSADYAASGTFIVEGTLEGSYLVPTAYVNVGNSAVEISISPTDNATDISINEDITITFNQPIRKIDNSTVTNTDLPTIVTLKEGSATGIDVPFTATINPNKTTITIIPSSPLQYDTNYYVAVDNIVEGPFDNQIDATSSTFTTEEQDLTKPSVVNINTSGSSIAVNTSQMVITFDEEMDTDVFGTVTINNGANLDTPTWDTSKKVITYNLNGLSYETTYNISIGDFNDEAGNVMDVNNSYSFTTVLQNEVKPHVTNVTPNGSNIPISEPKLVITFDKAMDNILGGTVTLDNGAIVTSPVWNADNTAVTYDLNGLANGTTYMVTISDFSSQDGEIMDENSANTFTTIILQDTTKPEVTLVMPNDANVPITEPKLSIIFDEVMDTSVSGNVVVDNSAVVSNPVWDESETVVTYDLGNLKYTTPYILSISSFSDEHGNIMAEDNLNSFTTLVVENVAPVRKTSNNQSTVNFTISNELHGTWSVYNSATSTTPLQNITAFMSGTTLTLYNENDVPAGAYYVAVTEPGKSESARIKLVVKDYVPSKPSGSGNDDDNDSTGSNATPTTAPTTTPKPTPTPTPAPTPAPTLVEAKEELVPMGSINKKEIIDDETGVSLATGNSTKYLYGYPDGSIKPDATVTRAEFATMIYSISTNNDKIDPEMTKSIFEDIPDDEWYAVQINYLANKGLLNGYPDGTFKPDQEMTRAEVATCLAKFAKTDETSSPVGLSDINGHWAEEDINILITSGVISGYPDGAFKPDAPVTRAEAITMINKTLDREYKASEEEMSQSPFTDINPEHWAYEEILCATKNLEY